MNPSPPTQAFLEPNVPAGKAGKNPPKKNKGGRPRKQRRCIAGGYDYLNWCTNQLRLRLEEERQVQEATCDGPRRIPMFGCNFMDTNREGVQHDPCMCCRRCMQA